MIFYSNQPTGSHARNPYKPYRTFLAVLLSIFSTFSTNAVEYSLGFAQTNQGDDAPRPSIFSLVRFDNDIYWHFYTFGRTIGPIRERTAVSTIGRYFSLTSRSPIQGMWGLAVMQEDIKIANTSQSPGDRLHYNVGFKVGLRALVSENPLSYFAWESYLYPAGTATLFLVSGRQQLLSFGMGWKLR